jgi:putative aldouronate transport system substrate-binding protein
MARLMGLIYEDKNGNYQATWTNPIYLEMLKFLNKVYQAGFMPEEQFLWDTDQIQQNIVNGMYFCTLGNVGGSHNYYRQHFGDSGMWWAPVDPPKSEQGWEAALPTRDLDGSYNTFITKNAKDPGRLIRFFSFMHSPEGQFLAFWGEEGETFEWTDDGYCKLLPEVAKMEDDDVAKMIELWGIKHIFYTFRDQITRYGYSPPPDRPAEKMSRDMSDFYRKYQYTGDAIDALYPPSESEEAEIRTAIELYMDEQVMSMVLAKSEDELMDIYDESIAKIKDMGLSKLNKWRNDEMWKRKNQLGVKFVSPRYLTK